MLSVLKSVMLRSIRAAGYDLVRAPRQYGPLLPPCLRRRHADDAIVRVVKAHLAEAAGVPSGLPLGRRWSTFAERVRARIAAISTTEELLALGQSHDAGVEIHVDPDTLRQLCRTVDLALRDRLPPELTGAFQSIHSPRLALNTVDYCGRPLDLVTLCAAQTILQVMHQLPERPITVCDIGGGTGKYAHAWASNAVHRPGLIVIIDAPETLVYAEALLRSEYGERLQYLAHPYEVPQRTGIVLCPLGSIDALRGITLDLITNIGSMQEMPDAWIDFYMDWMDRQSCGYFYSSQTT